MCGSESRAGAREVLLDVALVRDVQRGLLERARSPEPEPDGRRPTADGRRPTAPTTDDRRPRDPKRARDRTVHVTGGGGGCGAAEVAPDPLLS